MEGSGLVHGKDEVQILSLGCRQMTLSLGLMMEIGPSSSTSEWDLKLEHFSMLKTFPLMKQGSLFLPVSKDGSKYRSNL